VPQQPHDSIQHRVRKLAVPIRPYALRIAVASLLAGLLVGLWLSRAEARPQARARIGLTTAVQWPFYDVVRERLATAVEAKELAQQVSVVTGNDDVSFAAAVPPEQAFVDITATAPTSAQAAASANAAADLLVAESLKRRAEANVKALEPFDARLTELSRNIKAIDTTITELIGREATLAAAERSTPATAKSAQERADVQTQLETARNARGVATAEKAEVQSRVDRLQLDSRAAAAEVEVLRRAAPASGGRRLAIPGGIVAGLLCLVLSALAAVLWDRDRGRVRDPRQIAASGLRPLGELDLAATGHARDSSGRATALELFDHAFAAGATTVGIIAVDPTDSGATTSSLADTLLLAGYDIAEVLADGRFIDEPLVDIDVDDVDSANHLVLSWPSHEDRVADARDALSAICQRVDLTLVDCGHAGSDSWRPRARSCDAVVLVGRSGLNRVSDLLSIDHRLDGTCSHLGVILITGAAQEATPTRPATAETATARTNGHSPALAHAKNR
jgi:hypothetical protein